MELNLIQESIDLMLYGMGIVFVFLTVLVFSTAFMSRLLIRVWPEQPTPNVAKNPQVADVDPVTLKVIQAAIDQHRKRP
jgi:oxaloacetate decarboxylase gamma subunit